MPTSREERRQREAINARLFRETCEIMGGKYSEEYGMVESDVGDEHFDDYETSKQWCYLPEGKTPEGRTGSSKWLFRIPGEVSLHYPGISLMDSIEFQMTGFYSEAYYPEQQKMCFQAEPNLGLKNEPVPFTLPGVMKVCVHTMPLKKYGEPVSTDISFPPWMRSSSERYGAGHYKPVTHMTDEELRGEGKEHLIPEHRRIYDSKHPSGY